MGFPKVLHLAAINYLGGFKVSFACISEARVKFHYSFRLFSRSSSRIRSSRHNIARVCFRCLERSIKKIYDIATDNSGIYVVDVAAWATGEGRSYESIGLDFMARQPFSAAGQVSFAFHLARSLRPLIVPRKRR